MPILLFSQTPDIIWISDTSTLAAIASVTPESMYCERNVLRLYYHKKYCKSDIVPVTKYFVNIIAGHSKKYQTKLDTKCTETCPYTFMCHSKCMIL